MSDTGARRNRREVVAAVTGGTILGAIWGAAFPIVATERRPSFAVVGHRNAQVILIDSASARVLLLLGEPSPTLIDRLPAIMTMFRQRIDLIVATPESLTAHAKPIQDRWRTGHAVAVGRSGPSTLGIMQTTMVTDGVDIALDDRTLLEIRTGHRNEWKATEAALRSPHWCAMLHTGAGTVVMAPDVASIATVGPPASHLMIVPNLPNPETLAISPALSLAVNFDSETIGTRRDARYALTRIFPVDVARFVVGSQGLELPEWTTLPGRADDD